MPAARRSVGVPPQKLNFGNEIQCKLIREVILTFAKVHPAQDTAPSEYQKP